MKLFSKKRDDEAYLVTGNIKHFPKEPFVVKPHAGRIDCKVETRDYIYLFEFKRDDTADEAFAEVLNSDYTDKTGLIDVLNGMLNKFFTVLMNRSETYI